MITREDLISAERALYHVRHDMVYKRGELTRRLGGSESRDGDGGDDQGWMSRVFASTLGRNQGECSESHVIEDRSTDVISLSMQRQIHCGGKYKGWKHWSSRSHADWKP